MRIVDQIKLNDGIHSTYKHKGVVFVVHPITLAWEQLPCTKVSLTLRLSCWLSDNFPSVCKDLYLKKYIIYWSSNEASEFIVNDGLEDALNCMADLIELFNSQLSSHEYMQMEADELQEQQLLALVEVAT